MLTPQCHPRDFLARAGPNSPKKRLCCIKQNVRGGITAVAVLAV